MVTKGIKYLSYADRSGYGTSAIDYIAGLLNADVPLTWEPFVFDRYGYVRWTSDKKLPIREEDENGDDAAVMRLLDVMRKPSDYDTLLMHTQPEYWPRYWEQNRRRIGYTVWETDHIPRHWAALLNTAERICVPCRFNVDVFKADGVKPPISIVPHVYRKPHDITLQEINGFRKKLGIRDDPFVFYTINAWTARKALWETVTAYLEAFTDKDPVVLIVKTGDIGVRNEDATAMRPTTRIIAELCAGRRNIPEILLISRHMSLREIDLLHHIGNCYVSLTHSEGWGLGAFDAAGLGNPIIITGWGGHLDYLGTDYSGLVDYRLTPVRDLLGYGSYETNQKWAQADRDHAVHLMREIVRNPAAAREKAAKTGHTIRASFSEASVIHRLIEALNESNTE